MTTEETNHRLERLRAAQDNGYTIQDVLDGLISLPHCGEIYGYCYQPERFTGGEHGVYGTSHTFHNPDGTSEKAPYFYDRDRAVNYLKERGVYGRVQRYACDPAFLREEPRYAYLGSDRYELPPAPWITAGVTDIVNQPPDDDGVPVHLLREIDPVIHVLEGAS